MTREKAEGAKAYIERKYAKLKNEEKEKKEGKLERFEDVYSLGQTFEIDGQNELVCRREGTD